MLKKVKRPPHIEEMIRKYATIKVEIDKIDSALTVLMDRQRGHTERAAALEMELVRIYGQERAQRIIDEAVRRFERKRANGTRDT